MPQADSAYSYAIRSHPASPPVGPAITGSAASPVARLRGRSPAGTAFVVASSQPAATRSPASPRPRLRFQARDGSPGLQQDRDKAAQQHEAHEAAPAMMTCCDRLGCLCDLLRSLSGHPLLQRLYGRGFFLEGIVKSRVVQEGLLDMGHLFEGWTTYGKKAKVFHIQVPVALPV